MPKPPKVPNYKFPAEVFVDEPKRPYTPIGTVRAKENFMSLTSDLETEAVCKNFYRKAMIDLLKYARAKGADAVINAKSVVFLEDGRVEMYKTPECSDDGGEGQILAQGTAVIWKPAPAPSAVPKN
jgi:hypothetical protein